MKYLIPFLLIASVSNAGQKYQQVDPKLNDEIRNIYYEINNSNGNKNYLVGRVIQSTQCASASVISGTSASFNLIQGCTITPKYSTSKIRISATSGMTILPSGAIYYITFFRGGGTDLSNGYGFQTMQVNIATASNWRFPISMTYLDSPSTTSDTSYSVAVRNNDNTSGYTYNPSGGLSILLLEEISQ